MSRTATPSRVLEEPHASRTLTPYCYPATGGADWDPYMGGKFESRSLDSPETVQEDLVERFSIDYPILNTISGLASDYPHWDFDHPGALGDYLETMYTDEEREQVLSETPAEAFGIDI